MDEQAELDVDEKLIANVLADHFGKRFKLVQVSFPCRGEGSHFWLVRGTRTVTVEVLENESSGFHFSCYMPMPALQQAQPMLPLPAYTANQLWQGPPALPAAALPAAGGWFSCAFPMNIPVGAALPTALPAAHTATVPAMWNAPVHSIFSNPIPGKLMPYTIRKRGPNDYVVRKKHGDKKVIGHHKSRASARRQIAAIYANSHEG